MMSAENTRWFERWLLVLAWLSLAGCGQDELPAFARPPPFDAATWDAGVDAGADDDAG